MATYVRARDTEELRRRVDSLGRHVDVAFRAGISPVRLSQVLSGAAPTIPLTQAANLEDVLGVPRGALFGLDDSADLIGPYVSGPNDDPEPGAA